MRLVIAVVGKRCWLVVKPKCKHQYHFLAHFPSVSRPFTSAAITACWPYSIARTGGDWNKFDRTANLSGDITRHVSATIPRLITVIKRTNTLRQSSFITACVWTNRAADWCVLCSTFVTVFHWCRTASNTLTVATFASMMPRAEFYTWSASGYINSNYPGLHLCRRSSSSTSFWLSSR